MALKIVKSSPLAPTREQAVMAAQRAFSAGDLDAAAKHFLAALELNPRDPDLYLQFAIVLIQQEEYNKAVVALRQVLELRADDVDALNALGVVMYTLGWHAAAETFFRRVLELKPDHPAAKNSLVEAVRQVRETGDQVAPELEYLVKLARPQRQTLSLCMIVKNEEPFLEGCLESVKGVVDEIVIVDTGSTDSTIAIAERYGAKIYHFPWTGDFSAARNVSLEHATSDWILVLDADERLEPGSAEALQSQMKRPEYAGFALTIQNKVGDGEGDSCQMATIFRLFRNRPDIRFEGMIHEQAILSAQRTGLLTTNCNALIVHLGYMETHMNQRDKLNRNLSMLEKQAQSEPDHPYVYYNLGQTLKMMGRLDEAEQNYVRALTGLKAGGTNTSVPFYANLYFNLGDLYRQLKNFDRAHEVLDEGISIYPTFPDLYYTKGFAYLDAEQYREAISYFERCQAMKGTIHAGGTDVTITGHKGLNAIGVCYAKLGETKLAKSYLKMAIEQNPAPDANQYTNLGVLHTQDQEWPEAMSAFVTALGLDPKELRAWINLATISYRMERYQEALEAWDHAMELDVTLADARVLRAETLMRLGRFSEATADLERELVDHSDSVLARLNLGLCQLVTGDSTQARETWSQCADLADFQALLALEAVLAGRPLPEKRPSDQDLVRVWSAAVDLALSHDRGTGMQPLIDRRSELMEAITGFDLGMGQVFFKRGLNELALEFFLHAQIRMPQEAGVYVALGDTCLALGQRDDAQIMFAKAVELAPHAPYPRRQLANRGAVVV